MPGRGIIVVRRLIYLVVAITFLLLGTPEKSFCYAAGTDINRDDSKIELDWDYLNRAHFRDRFIDTVSVHILENVSKTKNKSIYRGITVTRPTGYLIDDNQRTRDSSAVGVGPVYMIRYEKALSRKLSEALDVSGGVIVYDEAFPAGGRYFNFMWRIGPRLIYKINENSSLTLGYTLMHVSNGFQSHNPGYNGEGVTLGFVTRF